MYIATKVEVIYYREKIKMNDTKELKPNKNENQNADPLHCLLSPWWNKYSLNTKI